MYKIKPYRLNTRIDRDVFDLFDNFFTEGFNPTRQLRNFKVDVRDLKDKYLVVVEVPGVVKEDISIKFENDSLTISITKNEENKDETDDYIHRERQSFISERKIYLEDVDPSKLNAKLNNGILSIELLKLEHKISSYMIDID